MPFSPVPHDRHFTIAARIRSVRYAARGVAEMFLSQHNAWVHAAATLLVICAGLLLGVTAHDWCWLIMAIIAVWTAEAFNTALEFLCDLVSPELHPLVAKAKDLAAAAVLLSAFGAMCVGIIVLGPYLLQGFQR